MSLSIPSNDHNENIKEEEISVAAAYTLIQETLKKLKKQNSSFLTHDTAKEWMHQIHKQLNELEKVKKRLKESSPNSEETNNLINKIYLPLLRQTLVSFHAYQTITYQLLATLELTNYYRLMRPFSKNVIDEFSSWSKLHHIEDILLKEMHEGHLSQILGIREDTLNSLFFREVRELLAHRHGKMISPQFHEKFHTFGLLLLSQNSLLSKRSNKNQPFYASFFALDFAKNMTSLVSFEETQNIITELLIEDLNENLSPLATEMTATLNLSILLFCLAMLSRTFALPGLSSQIIMHVSKEVPSLLLKQKAALETCLALPIHSKKHREKIRLHIAEAFIKRGVDIEEALKMASAILNGSYNGQSSEVKHRPLLDITIDYPLPLSDLRQQLRNEILIGLTPQIDPKEALALAEEMILLLGIEEEKEKLPYSFWYLINKQLEILNKKKDPATCEALAKHLKGYMKPNVEMFVLLLKWVDPWEIYIS